MDWQKWLLLFVILSLHVGCAQMVAPTGGIKDTTPPEVLSSKPASRSHSFEATEIAIRFDEYIQVSNIEEQLIISPPFNEKPEVIVDGKQLKIRNIPSLQPNTTYTLNFGNSISDVHEKNVLSNFSYVFSTGSQLDSLSINGNIVNGFTLKPESSYTIGLYLDSSFNDSTVYLKKPLYLTKTDASGLFQLNNLPQTRFKLFAFKDENKNLLYNSNEPFCIYDDSVRLSDSLAFIRLSSSEGNKYPINHILDTFSFEKGKYTFVVYKPQDLIIKPQYSDSFIQWTKAGLLGVDTLFFFHKFGISDTFQFSIKSTSIDTTILIKPKRAYKPAKPQLAIPKIVQLNQPLKIESNYPIAKINMDTSFIQLTEDSLLIYPEIKIDSIQKSVIIDYTWKEGKTYRLKIADSCIQDIHKQYHSKNQLTWTSPKVQDYSILTLNINIGESNYPYLVELWDDAEKEIYQTYYIQYSQQVTSEYMLPGKYKIKIVEDLNKNKRWDSGSILKQTIPEKVAYYSDIISLKANWDLEQTIDIRQLVN
ncbi:MAG: Ig-like domain-containing protein [Bacteroidia bacterium]|jgi:hypothetical protein|nr:Ig-like domain-containing protein [Bacteroidia bacterium]